MHISAISLSPYALDFVEMLPVDESPEDVLAKLGLTAPDMEDDNADLLCDGEPSIRLKSADFAWVDWDLAQELDSERDLRWRVVWCDVLHTNRAVPSFRPDGLEIVVRRKQCYPLYKRKRIRRAVNPEELDLEHWSHRLPQKFSPRKHLSVF